jgi:hypothetical protein
MALGVEIDEWRGLVRHRGDPDDPVKIVAPLGQSPGGGGSMPFLALDHRGQRWWLKVLDNPQGGRVVVTDQIVGRVAQLIDAPVCEVGIARIPDELAGFEYAPGRHLRPGLAHASRHVEGVVEQRELCHRNDDDNQRRHVGALALYDWCWGSDDQWLYSQARDWMLYSHDHGHYLPNGPGWSIESLRAVVDAPHGWLHPSDGLDPQTLIETAEKLESLTRAKILTVLLKIPPSWPVTDGELEALGWFLERRSRAVAARLRGIAGGGP